MTMFNNIGRKLQFTFHNTILYYYGDVLVKKNASVSDYIKHILNTTSLPSPFPYLDDGNQETASK